MIEAGDILGKKYRLTKLLGEGGMGAVYAAENLNTGRRVAVKVLHTALMASHEVSARFVREARATTAIAHPNIVEVLDLDSDSDHQIVYIVQEFLQGETIEARLESRPGNRLPVTEALALAIPIMEALCAAHALGIVHRDLKPGNLFLVRRPSGEWTPKIIDFGIAKDLGQDDPKNQTREGTTIGTPAYMSPEQVVGRQDVGAQTDVWAMGVVIFEMLSGRLPYEAESVNELMAKVLYQEPTHLSHFAPELPPCLFDLVDRALQRDRTLRFGSMQEMLSATRAVAQRISQSEEQSSTVHDLDSSQLFLPTSPSRDSRPSLEQLNVVQSIPADLPLQRKRGLIVGMLVSLVAFSYLGYRLRLRSNVSEVRARQPLETTGSPRNAIRRDAVAVSPPNNEIAVVAARVAPLSRTRVAITTNPEDADVFLDGRRIANPFDGELPASMELHRLEVTRSGYTTVVQDLSLEFPQTVRVRLRRGAGIDDQRQDSRRQRTQSMPAIVPAERASPPVAPAERASPERPQVPSPATHPSLEERPAAPTRPSNVVTPPPAQQLRHIEL